jgi:hypothetical protein
MARTYKRDSRGRFAGGGGSSGGSSSRPRNGKKGGSTTARQNPSPQQKAAATRRRNQAAKIARARRITRNVQLGIIVATTAAPAIMSATTNIAGAANYARAARRTAKMSRPIKVKSTRVR